MPTIPLNQTITAGQFPALSGVLKLASLIYLTQDGTEYSLSVQALRDFMQAGTVGGTLTSTDQLPEGNTNLYFLAERVITAAADAYVRYDEPQALTTAQINQFLDNLGILNKIRQPVGNVRRWEPNTPFYAETLVDGQMIPADIVFYQGDLYITNVDFTSGGTFEERRWPEGLMLTRLSKDTDLEYLEITANCTAPLTVGQEVGSYIAMRKMTIYEQESLPNARLHAPRQHHVSACNIEITAPLIIDIKRWNSGNNTEEQIGTITFDPAGHTGWIDGVMVFSDPYQPPNPEPIQLFFNVYDCLILRANTVPSGFQWARFNLLGTCLKFVNPDYDLPN